MKSVCEVYNNNFGIRLSKLRMQKGVSARDMSLSIGQNAGYINCIENGRSLPSMKNFFLICDYLGITPNDYFNYQTSFPKKLSSAVDNLCHLDDDKLSHISSVIEYMVANYVTPKVALFGGLWG